LHFSQLHPPQQLERAQRNFIDIINQGQGQLLDTLICHQQGYKIPVDITGSVVEYEDQRIVIGSFRDITEQKQAIAERNRFLYIIEASFNEIYIFDVERLQLQFVNLGAIRNLGYSQETLLKMNFFNLAPSFDQASFSELLMPLRQHQQNHLVYETEHQRADQTCYLWKFISNALIIKMINFSSPLVRISAIAKKQSRKFKKPSNRSENWPN
jgi:PAS domain-containing protein